LLINACPHPKLRGIFLRLLGAHVKKNARVEWVIWSPFNFRLSNLCLGEDSYIGTGSVIDLTAPIVLGDKVAISPGCILITHADCGEYCNNPLIGHFPRRCEAIRIGNNSWIGAGTTILCGVTIGSNVVIGASSLVNKDIPDYSVAYGIPAKVMRKIGIGINSQSAAGNAIRGLCPAGSR
jgi:galactoside O-acetyltransferase